MPDKVIDIPGVGPIAFPDSMSDDQMNAAAAKLYREANPEHPPVDPKHSWVATARDWLSTAGDVATGAVKGAIHSGQALTSVPVLPGGISLEDIGNAIGNVAGGATSQALYGTKAQPVSTQQAREATAYTNLPQRVGGGLETAVEMMVPGGAAIEAIPNAARAGRVLESIKTAAKDAPVDVSAAGDVALRIQELAERGGSMPLAVRKFLQRVTNPDLPPIKYPESFDFASNIGRLSANDQGRLTPVMNREVARLRVALSEANKNAAAAVGNGADYVAAMNEFGQAKRLEKFWDWAKDKVPGAIVTGSAGAVGGGTGAYVMKKLMDLLGESK